MSNDTVFAVVCDGRTEKLFSIYESALNYVYTSIRNVDKVEDRGEIKGYLFDVYYDNSRLSFEIRKMHID